jgi:hypothetical protein
MLQASFRQLALSCPQLRLAEELWAVRAEEAVWHAVGPTQFGRGDSLLVVLVDIESSLIRMDLGLPEATLATDLEEAHDTAWPEQIVLSVGASPGVSAEEVVMADELLAGTAIVVTTHTDRSDPTLLSGLAEGRRLASTFFAALASAFPKSLVDRHVGIGLDPPAEGVM